MVRMNDVDLPIVAEKTRASAGNSNSSSGSEDDSSANLRRKEGYELIIIRQKSLSI